MFHVESWKAQRGFSKHWVGDNVAEFPVQVGKTLTET
jgi:hypothetical protein